jgi:hypothetical protein
MSLNQTLGTLPSGNVITLKDDDMTKILREVYVFNNEEKKRRDQTRKRIDLYQDKGQAQFEEMANTIWNNAKVRRWNKKFIELAQYQNLTKRVVREISAVYSESARRRVKSPVMDKRYQELQRITRMDRRMRLGNQMLNLCNETVVWFDIESGMPVLRVSTPDNFWAVAHPNDPTLLVALIFDRAPPPGRPVTMDTPVYMVVDDETVFFLNQLGGMLAGSRKPHGLSRMPMILVHKNEPMSSLLDPDPGNDIIAAHKALALVNTMLLRHQKQGTKQAVASGDVGDMPVGQPMSAEHILQAPEGVVMNTLDLGAEPDSYIKAARAIIKQIAANYGIPESVFDLSYQATSGFEIELKRVGLREVRRDQILDWRPVERDLAEIMAEALANANSPLAFNTLGWAIDFGEVETPQDPMQRLTYWEKLKSLNLITVRDMYMHLNPEATPEEADAILEENGKVNSEFTQSRIAMIPPGLAPNASQNDGDDEEEMLQ